MEIPGSPDNTDKSGSIVLSKMGNSSISSTEDFNHLKDTLGGDFSKVLEQLQRLSRGFLTSRNSPPASSKNHHLFLF